MAGKTEHKPGCGECEWRGEVTYETRPPSTPFEVPITDLRAGTAECHPPEPARPKKLRKTNRAWQVWVPESNAWRPGHCVLLRTREVNPLAMTEINANLRESVVSRKTGLQDGVK